MIDKLLGKNNRTIVIFLTIISLIQIRTEISLLLDHFTFTSLVFAIKNQPLAFMFLAFTPSLLRINSK